MTETVITGIYDQVEEFMNQDRKRLYIFRVLVCSFFFFMGMPMTVKVGKYSLQVSLSDIGHQEKMLLSPYIMVVCHLV